MKVSSCISLIVITLSVVDSNKNDALAYNAIASIFNKNFTVQLAEFDFVV